MNEVAFERLNSQEGKSLVECLMVSIGGDPWLYDTKIICIHNGTNDSTFMAGTNQIIFLIVISGQAIQIFRYSCIQAGQSGTRSSCP